MIRYMPPKINARIGLGRSICNYVMASCRRRCRSVSEAFAKVLGDEEGQWALQVAMSFKVNETVACM